MKFKLLLSILTLSLFGINSKCQDKGNYIWNLGYALPLPFENYPDSIRMRYGGTDIDFNNSPPTLRRIEREISFNGACTSICDDDGNLLFYTNGCYVFNRDHTLMENGQDINAGKFHDDYCSRDNGYISGLQSALIIPDFYKSGIYYLVHEKVEQLFPDEYSTLQYSVIDMNANNGLGRVAEKNIRITQDSIYFGWFTAVKHANQRDWWIVVPEDSSDVYIVVLLDSLGFKKQHEQKIGPKVGYYGQASGQAKISPDGKKYAR